MNRDDIIILVRASAVEIYGPMPDEKMYDIFIERCARLIDMGCAAAVAAEREACAQIAHDTYEGFGVDAKGVSFVKKRIIEEIRARGNHG